MSDWSGSWNPSWEEVGGAVSGHPQIQTSLSHEPSAPYGLSLPFSLSQTQFPYLFAFFSSLLLYCPLDRSASVGSALPKMIPSPVHCTKTQRSHLGPESQLKHWQEEVFGSGDREQWRWRGDERPLAGQQQSERDRRGGRGGGATLLVSSEPKLNLADAGIPCYSSGHRSKITEIDQISIIHIFANDHTVIARLKLVHLTIYSHHYKMQTNQLLNIYYSI